MDFLQSRLLPLLTLLLSSLLFFYFNNISKVVFFYSLLFLNTVFFFNSVLFCLFDYSSLSLNFHVIDCDFNFIRLFAEKMEENQQKLKSSVLCYLLLSCQKMENSTSLSWAELIYIDIYMKGGCSLVIDNGKNYDSKFRFLLFFYTSLITK